MAARSGIVTAATVVGRARELKAQLRARAQATEAARRIPDESIADLRAAGLFRVLQPKRFGGLELDFDAYQRSIAALGGGCGATSWTLSVVAMDHWQLGMFPAEAQEEVWGGNADALVASSLGPPGEAVRESGGYRVSGRWSFATGCDAADWLMVGARTDDDADGGAGYFLLSRDQCTIEDDPNEIGLSGAGDRTIIANGAMVPRHRMLSSASALSGTPPGAAINPGAIYRVPVPAAVGASFAVPAVAIARGALDEFLETTKVRMTRGAALGGRKGMAEFQTIQIRVAEAAALLDSAELLLARDFADTLRTASRKGALDPARAMRNRRDHAFAARLAQQAADRLFEAAGGQLLFDSSHLQRLWRDVRACARHAALSWDLVGTMYGRFALGLPAEA